MTGEQLVGTSTETLEAMTDEQLLEWVKPILTLTRPSPEKIIPEIPKEKKPKKPKKETPVEEVEQLSMEQIMEQLKSLKE